MRPKREVEDISSPRRRFSRRARQPALPRSTQGHDRDRGLTDAGARRSCRALRGLRRDSHLPQFRLMGRSSNGELACRHRHFSVNAALFVSIAGRSCAAVRSATDGRSQTGTNMSETYFSASTMPGICRAGQADHTLTVSQPRLSGRAISGRASKLVLNLPSLTIHARVG